MKVEDKLPAPLNELGSNSVFQRIVCRLIAEDHSPQRFQYGDRSGDALPNVHGTPLSSNGLRLQHANLDEKAGEVVDAPLADDVTIPQFVEKNGAVAK